MSGDRSAPRLALAVWAAAGLVAALALSRPARVLPERELGLRRFATPEVTSARHFAQTFDMTANGLEAIDIETAGSGTAATGDIQLSLIDTTVSGSESIVRAAAVPSAQVLRESSFRFQFAPVANSDRRAYRLEIAATQPASGVALRATKGDGYSRGSLLVNGRTRWADLAFRTHAPTHSRWTMLWRRPSEAGRPPGWVAVMAFMASWIAAAALLRSLAGGDLA